jgi:hypothetical protein
MRHVVDANGADVGVLDIASGQVTRRVGDIIATLGVTPNGFMQSDVVFLHTSDDCSGERYLPNNPGGFTHAAWLVNGTVFFTLLADASNPLFPQPLNSFEVVTPGSDPDAPGVCTPAPMGLQSVGRARALRDPSLNALVAPFRLE